MSSQEEIEDDSYGDFHKIVLQGLMAAGYLDLEGVKRLFKAACDYIQCSQEERAYKTSMEYVQKIVKGINNEINSLNMSIKSASCELSGIKYYIFMLTVEKSIMKQQLLFSKIEIDMFQKCMDGMLRKYSNFSLPFNECINILREFDPRSSLTVAEAFVNKMIELNYFTKYLTSPTEFDVTLGVRCIREFEPLLADLYKDVVRICSLCKMILLHGYRCPSCKILLHRPCYTKYVSNCKTCTNCNCSWDKENDMILRSRDTDEGAPDEQIGAEPAIRRTVPDRSSSKAGPSGLSNGRRHQEPSRKMSSESEEEEVSVAKPSVANGRRNKKSSHIVSSESEEEVSVVKTPAINGRVTRNRSHR